MKKYGSKYSLAFVINLSVAASLYLIPGILGYGWNSTPGPSLLNTHDVSKRYPAIDITAEPWGASVVLTPSESRLRQFVANGQLPLWNPYQGIGEPYAAQGDGSPYALTAIIRAFAPPSLGNLVTFLSFALGAAAMYAFLGLLGLSKEVRLVGAIAVFLSTANTFHIARYNIGDQNALIPVQFLAVTFAVLKRSPLAYLALACVSAVTVTAGFFQSAIVTVAAATAFAAVLAYIRYDSRRDQSICFLSIVSATLVGLTFAAPFWLPIAELSQIAFHKNVPSVVVYTPPIYNLVAFFFPALFGNTLGHELGAFVDWSNLFATSSAGVVVLCAIGIVACKWTRPDLRLIFRFATILAILLILRFMNWPPFSWLGTQPLFSQLATKHTQAIAAFLLLVSAMLVLEQIKDWSFPRVKLLFLIFGVSLVATLSYLQVSHLGISAKFINPYSVLIVGTFAYGAWHFARPMAQFSDRSTLILIVTGATICAELSLYLPLGITDPLISFVRAAICIAWVAAWWAIYVERNAISIMITIVIALAYSAIIFFPENGLPNQVYSRRLPNFAEFLKHQVGNDYRSFGIFPNYSSQVGVQDLDVVGPFSTSGFAAFVHSIDPAGKLGFYGSTVFLLAGLGPDRYLKYRSLFDWIGVRYIVVERSLFNRQSYPTEFHDYLLRERPGSYKKVYSDDKVVVIESLNARPRFEFSSSIRIFTSDFAIVRELQSNPTIVDHSVLVESTANDTFLQQLAAEKPTTSGAATVEVIEDNPNDLQLRLQTNEGGILVIKDAYFSGWKAYLDDRRVPIIRVNAMARGVEVASAGTHVVKFYYQPLGFRLGLAGGSAAFLALTVILMMNERGLSSRLEVGIVCCGTACLIFILVAIFLITRTDDGPIQLGSENVAAINLTDVKLKWRRTDSTEGRELFTRGVPVSRLPIATDGHNELPLHIGDLVYAPNVGLAEIDMRGHFRPVSANDGSIVTICSAFGAPNTQSNQAALYKKQRWQIIALPETTERSLCHHVKEDD